MRLTCLAITSPNGDYTADARPGHSVAGLLAYLDPFAREERHSLWVAGVIAGRVASDDAQCPTHGCARWRCTESHSKVSS